MGWVANLSNGETVIESKSMPGQSTPWQGLLQYCKANNVTITGLRLTVNNTTIEAMPSKMCGGYFQAYEASRILFRDGIRHKQGIGSIIGDSVYITWIDLDNAGNKMNYVHQEIRPLSEVKIHTTVY